MDLKQTGWEGMDWIHVTQDKGQWTGFCEHDNESRNLSIWVNILLKDSAPCSHLFSWLAVEVGSLVGFSAPGL
jgi:hypothetical protein